jgi:Uma2 family endonuclease
MIERVISSGKGYRSMTVATDRSMTLKEFLDYDDGTDKRYELVDGVLVEMGTESRLNHKIASFLFATFLRLGLPEELLTIGVQIAVNLSAVTARQPDFAVLSEDCAAALEGATSDIIEIEMIPPALVVEVVSPGEEGSKNYDRDYVDKPREYSDRRITELWRIDPSREWVQIGTLIAGAYQFATFKGNQAIVSPTFPELQLTAAQVLAAKRSG